MSKIAQHAFPTKIGPDYLHMSSFENKKRWMWDEMRRKSSKLNDSLLIIEWTVRESLKEDRFFFSDR